MKKNALSGRSSCFMSNGRLLKKSFFTDGPLKDQIHLGNATMAGKACGEKTDITPALLCMLSNDFTVFIAAAEKSTAGSAVDILILEHELSSFSRLCICEIFSMMPV